MYKVFLATAALAVIAMAGCSSVNYPQHKNDNNTYHLNGAPKPYQTGIVASAKYKAYVAPFKTKEERYGRQEYRVINYTEFIKAALAGKFGNNLAFVDREDQANVIVDMKSKINGFDLKSSVSLYITARINGVLVTAKGEVYYRKPHWPPTSDDVRTETETAADALVSVLREMPDGTLGVAPLNLYEDKDTYYFDERNGVSVMQGPLGYNVEKHIEVD